MNHQLEKIPGVIWNFSQPIADNMEEAVSGVKGELAIKIYGDDLRTLEAKGDQIVNVMSHINGVQDLGLFRVVGQPNLNLSVDRVQAARYQINVSDVQDAIQTAVGGNAVSQVLEGEQRYDLVLRYRRPIATRKRGHRKHSPAGALRRARLSGAALQCAGCATARRKSTARRTRAMWPLSTACAGATSAAPWKRLSQRSPAGETAHGLQHQLGRRIRKPETRQQRLMIILPITILVIFIILYTMFHSFKWASLMLVNMAMAPLGRAFGAAAHGHSLERIVGRRIPGAVRSLRADRRDHAGIHQPASRARQSVIEAAVEGAVLRLRPIMMTTLVATLGLLPAALSRGIGSDSQRPFAIVIVGGLMVAMMMNIFLLPTVYVWIAGERDVLPVPEGEEV